MTAIAVHNNFYNENQGVSYLSKTFQSSLRFTPSDVTRRTASQENFVRKREDEEKVAKEPWGRKFSYGGIGTLNLPTEWRPKDEPPRVQKGHRHFSSGVCVNPRYVALSERYAETSLRRSNCRVTDELIESPTKVDLTKHGINLKFPAEHPFATHIERACVFPPYEIPTAYENAKAITEIAAAAPGIQILSKARGAPYRYEMSSTPQEWERKPVEWIEGPNFFQLLKGGDKGRQKYYPIPPKSLDPNMRFSRNISNETGLALENLRQEQWTSTYKRDMTTDEVFQSKYVKVLDDGDFNESQVEQITPTNDNEKRIAEKSVCFDDDPRISNNTDRESNNKSDEDVAEKNELIAPKMSLVSPMYAVVRKDKANKFISASYPPDESRKKPNLENGKSNTYSAELIRGWSRSDIRRKFNRTHQDHTPDLRRKPDLRITTNERRHRFPDVGDTGSYVWNGLAVPHLEGAVYG